MRVVRKEPSAFVPDPALAAATLPSEERRICRQCGGIVEVITIPWRTGAGRQVRARIGACVRCAQWYNEAGLRELERCVPPEMPAQDDQA